MARSARLSPIASFPRFPISSMRSLELIEPMTHRGQQPGHAIRHPRYDLNTRPFIVIWEVTRACDLACRHCRAEACSERTPGELDTQEAFRLIDQIASFGQPRPLFVMT